MIEIEGLRAQLTCMGMGHDWTRRRRRAFFYFYLFSVVVAPDIFTFAQNTGIDTSNRKPGHSNLTNVTTIHNQRIHASLSRSASLPLHPRIQNPEQVKQKTSKMPAQVSVCRLSLKIYLSFDQRYIVLLHYLPVDCLSILSSFTHSPR